MKLIYCYKSFKRGRKKIPLSVFCSTLLIFIHYFCYVKFFNYSVINFLCSCQKFFKCYPVSVLLMSGRIMLMGGNRYNGDTTTVICSSSCVSRGTNDSSMAPKRPIIIPHDSGASGNLAAALILLL